MSKTRENKGKHAGLNVGVAEAVILCVAAILLISPLIYAAFFAHPSADDYDYSLFTFEAMNNGGLLAAVQAAGYTTINFLTESEYYTLYAPIFFQSLQPAIFGDDLYWITCPLMLVCSYCGFAALVHSLVKYAAGYDGKAWFPISILLWLFFIIAMPSPSQGLYWFNGAMNYIPFWSCLAATIGLMIRYYVSNRNSILVIILASALAFFVAGGNQMNSVPLIVLVAYITFFCVKNEKRYLALIVLAVAIIGFMIVATHPGTTARLGLRQNRSFLGTAAWSILNTLDYFSNWVDLELLVLFGALFILFIPILRRSSEASLARKWMDFKHVVVFLVLTTLLFILLSFVPRWGVGSIPGRAEDVMYASFLICFAVVSFLCSGIIYYSLIEKRWQERLAQSQRKTIFAFAALILVIAVLPNNFTLALREIADGSLAAYDAEIEKRYDLIENSDASDVVVPALEHKPELIYFDDITRNPDNWKNQSYSIYYGINSIRTE